MTTTVSTLKSPTTIRPASRLVASSPPYTVTTLCCYLYLWMWVVSLRISSSAYTYVITLVAKAIALGMDCPRHRMRLGLSVLCLAVYSWSSCWLVSGPLDSGEECIYGKAINADSLFSYFKSKFHCFDAAIIIGGFIIDVCLKDVLEEAASIVVILRLWRVFKIVEEFSAGASDRTYIRSNLSTPDVSQCLSL